MSNRDNMSRRDFLRGKPLHSILSMAICRLESQARALGAGVADNQPKPEPLKGCAPTQLPVMMLDGAGRAAPPDTAPRQQAFEGETRAFVNKQHCLAWLSSPCSACREHCPEEGAIVIDAGRPTVVPDKCTSCGKCRDVCPAPVNAILILPRPRRHGHARRRSQ